MPTPAVVLILDIYRFPDIEPFTRRRERQRGMVAFARKFAFLYNATADRAERAELLAFLLRHPRLYEVAGARLPMTDAARAQMTTDQPATVRVAFIDRGLASGASSRQPTQGPHGA